VKFHCLYQDFVVDEDRALRMYERIAARDLVILFHAGRDPVWPTSEDASPARLLRIHRRFPQLRMVAAHTGAWRMWDEVAEHLAGEDLWLELSFAGDVPDEAWSVIWERHSPERYVFGSDSPWTDQVTTLEQVRRRLGDGEIVEQVLESNPAQLLGLSA
jgi:predicted TIM-barrel fold metal-dependent hydrolase